MSENWKRHKNNVIYDNHEIFAAQSIGGFELENNGWYFSGRQLKVGRSGRRERSERSEILTDFRRTINILDWKNVTQFINKDFSDGWHQLCLRYEHVRTVLSAWWWSWFGQHKESEREREREREREQNTLVIGCGAAETAHDWIKSAADWQADDCSESNKSFFVDFALCLYQSLTHTHTYVPLTNNL